ERGNAQSIAIENDGRGVAGGELERLRHEAESRWRGGHGSVECDAIGPVQRMRFVEAVDNAVDTGRTDDEQRLLRAPGQPMRLTQLAEPVDVIGVEEGQENRRNP